MLATDAAINPAASGTPAPAPANGGNGGGAPATGTDTNAANAQNQATWLANLPEDLRAHEAFKSHQTAKDFYNAHKSLYEQMGKTKDRIYVPGDQATAEEKAAYHKAVGIPDTPDGYKYELPPLPNGQQYNKEAVDAFNRMAHKLGLNNKQASELVKELTADTLNSHQAMAKEREAKVQAGEAALKKAWGDKYQTNIETAKHTFQRIAGDLVTEMKAEGIDTAILTSPAFHKLLVNLAPHLKEGTVPLPGGSKTPPPYKPGQGFSYPTMKV